MNMTSDQSSATPSSKDGTNPVYTTPSAGRSGGNLYPSRIAGSPSPPESDVASLSHLYPLSPPGLGISGYPAVLDSASDVHQSPIDENDIVIAVMGLTGVGKSSFVNTVAGRTEIPIGNDLRSQTRAVQPVRCSHPDGRRSIVLVDTPGFDDTQLSDARVLRIIAHWLKETYQNDIKLSGLLYLHRISDVRMAGTPLRNLSVFKDLCGDDNMKNIVLVTTMWDEVEESVGSQREEELLSDFWKDMILLGSRACRFRGTHESAWEIINRLDLEGCRQRCAPLQIQREMVDRALPLHETTAAKTLLRSLVQFAGEFKKVYTKLRNKARRKASPREPPSGIRLHPVPSRSPTIGSSSSESSWAMVLSRRTSRNASRDSTSPSSPALSTSSGCSVNGRRDALSAIIRVLGVVHQMADIGHVPMLRGIIGTVLRIAQLIQDMGGAHHAITQVVESSGWLLDEITRYAVGSKLSRDMNRALGSFQKEIANLQKVVAKISRRGRIARFLLHDSDIQAITACTSSINAIYDKLGVKLAMDNRQAIARLEEQLVALCRNTTSRQCECGGSAVLHEEPQRDGQPSASSSQTS